MSVDPAKVELGFHTKSESCDLGQGLNVAGLLFPPLQNETVGRIK